MWLTIAQFEDGAMPLGNLIGDLDGLGAALEAVDAAWREEFTEEVGNLETIYAIRLEAFESGGRVPRQDAAADESIQSSIARLKRRIGDRLAMNAASANET